MYLIALVTRLALGTAALVICLATAQQSRGAAILVSYTIGGSPGDYELNFSVTNNMLAWPTQNIYAFGVRLSGDDIIGSPAIFSDSHPMDFNPFGSGGSNTNYNTLWQNVAAYPTYTNFLPGQTYAGFVAHITDQEAPTAVSWFAVSVSPGRADLYTGGENYDPPGIQGQENPGFEGVALPAVAAAAAPEPSTLVMSLIALGLFGPSLIRDRRGRQPAGLAVENYQQTS
jgi:hypothetical protein